MINTNDEIFKKNKRRNFILLIISIVLLLGACSLVFLGLKNKNKELPAPINLKEVKKKENRYSSVEVNIKPYLFAVYEVNKKEESAKYYFVMDKDKNLYILYMKDEDYHKLNIDSVVENPITVYGYAKPITYDLKKQAIDSYNKYMETEYLTKENFNEYVGSFYLDMKTPINDSSLYGFGVLILGILFLTFISLYIIRSIKDKQMMNKLTPELLKKIDTELALTIESKYEHMKFYLLKNHLVDFNNNVIIIPYSDIIWIYPYDRTYNGLLVNKYLKVITKDNKKYNVASTRALDDNKDQILEEIENKIKEKNQNILIGYSKENKKKVKEITKTKKKNEEETEII